MNKTLMIIGMVLMAVVLAACNVTVQQPGQQQQNTISVNGNAQFKANPDEATVMVRVETNGTNAKEAQDKNSVDMTAVQKALKRAGVEERDMETMNYNIYENFVWDYKEQRQYSAGFKASHTLKLKTTKLNMVGEYIQIAVDNGATNLDSVSFSLSKEAEKDAKDEALRQATKDARGKADALADGLDLSIKKVVSVSINEYNVIPFYRGMAEVAMTKDAGGPMPAPPVAPQEVDVSANVQVVFEIA
jgi:hypothetical protein